MSEAKASVNLQVSRETMEQRITIREVLSCLVFHLAEFPAKCTLSLRHPDFHSPIFLTTSRAHAAKFQRLGHIVCTPIEYEALALALADGRCTRAEAIRELRGKLGNGQHRVEYWRLLNGVAQFDRAGERWTIGELVDALGAEPVNVQFAPEDDRAENDRDG